MYIIKHAQNQKLKKNEIKMKLNVILNIYFTVYINGEKKKKFFLQSYGLSCVTPWGTCTLLWRTLI